MDERLRFVARLLEGEKMAPLCAEFGTDGASGESRMAALRGGLELAVVLHDTPLR